jgi:hypothetical protein
MTHQEALSLLEHPAAVLLRSTNAALILGFLSHAFKEQHLTTVPEGRLRALLDAYLEDLRQSDPDGYAMTSAQYLGLWCDDAHQFLRKYYSDDPNEPVFELTSGAEKAFLWLGQLHGPTAFVGTESRLASIFAGLDDLLQNTTTDLNTRIDQLEVQARTIQREIDQIMTTGVVPNYTPVQINERFALIATAGSELLSDFRRVEENFKRIAQEIAEGHAQPDFTKGAILGNMLDAEDALQQSAQGQSFHAFWNLLLAPERTAKFEEDLQKVLALPQLSDTLKANRLLKHLIRQLLNEGEKVSASHQRMAANLRRVLDTTRAADRAQVQRLIKDIHTLAIKLRTNPPEMPIWEVEEVPEFYNSMSRPLWQAPENINGHTTITVADDTVSPELLKQFSNLPDVRLSTLRKNVSVCLADNMTVPLIMVLDRFPPRHGVTDILGYLIIATENPAHNIAHETEPIMVPGHPAPTLWNVPKVLFCRPSSHE